MRFVIGIALLLTASPLFAQSGPYTPQVNSSSTAPGYTIASGSDAAIPWNDPAIVEWASSVANYTPGTDVNTSFENLNYAVGPTQALPSVSKKTGLPNLGSPINDVVSLGQDGTITVGFTSPIANGPGNDFAVFSNGFLDGYPYAYSKFATVSVSSDGVNFFSFPTDFDQSSLVDNELFDASELYNIAGKYVAGFGTPFDLNQLAGVSPLLDVDDVRYVRITDAWDATDSSDNPILDDPESIYGFNFAGVAVLNDIASVPEPSTLALLLFGAVSCALWRATRVR
jgi:PEP-CTERM motif